MTTNKEKKLFPDLLFEISLVALFTVQAVVVLAVLFPSLPGREIDFSGAYQPKPEWYFLFLYQLTKYFPGAWTFVGAVLLPGLAFGLLLLVPFLDRSRSTAPGDRRKVLAAGFALGGAVVLLTILSLL